MAIISKCKGECCPVKQSCFRFIVKNDPMDQGWVSPKQTGLDCDLRVVVKNDAHCRQLLNWYRARSIEKRAPKPHGRGLQKAKAKYTKRNTAS